MKKPTAEEVFYDHIYNMINNLLIENVNYTNQYYAEQPKWQLLTDTKERARYILEEMEKIKHLIIPDKSVCEHKWYWDYACSDEPPKCLLCGEESEVKKWY